MATAQATVTAATATVPVDYTAIAAAATHKLGERSMLCRLPISIWQARKTDKALAAETARAHSADPTMHSHTRRLLAKEHLADINSAITEIKTTWYTHTLPWQDDGVRILRTSGVLPLKAKLDPLIDKLTNTLIPAFVAAYPTYREEMRTRQGPLFNINEYPHPNTIARKFSVALTFEPLPDFADWRADGIPDDLLATLAAQGASNTSAAIEQAQQDIYRRLRDAAAHMHNRLLAYQGTRKGAFHDTLVTNISDLLAVIPTLVISDDPLLSAIAEATRVGLTTHSPDTLRDDPDAREDTAAMAADIVKQLDDFLG